ncbi:MAG: hypothetical protein LC105_06145 [Chitinophagales bacterium]|nr:hypothetical protein [Chitinophagales bacterium]
MATIINKYGTLQGWNSLTVQVMGRDLEGITALKYDDSVTKENAYGAGKYPVGRTEGNYEATASITLLKEELDGIQAALPVGMRIQDIPAFNIEVVYETKSGLVRKDRIMNCEFVGNQREVAQGDGSIASECELICSHIAWNV